jgi:hypothetical protein
MKPLLVFTVAALVGATGVARASVACDAYRAVALWVASATADGAKLPLPSETGGFLFQALDNAADAQAELQGFDPTTGGRRTIRVRRVP